VDLRMISSLFGSPADRVGPVALRPRLTSGLPLSTGEDRRQYQYPPKRAGIHQPFGRPRLNHPFQLTQARSRGSSDLTGQCAA
jgi:hypothetical protein